MLYPEITNVKKNILVVDDEDNVREFLNTALSESFSVSTAGNCSDALGLMADTVFSLALVDVRMAGMNGLEFLTYCRKHCPEMHIILMTGHPDLKDAVSSIKEGALDYIAKPIDLNNLAAKINSALAEQGSEVKSSEEQILDSVFFQTGKYKILKSLGSGNSGLVLLVEKNCASYAMKIMKKKDSPEKHEISVKRFLREFKILEEMDHRNIVKVYKYGILPDVGTPFIIMEYIDGSRLSDYIANTAMDIKLRIHIIKQLASVLDYIHSLGFIHRDIKPDNIMITQNSQVKISDFGISKTQESSLTMMDDVMGSPHYMAPESFDSAKTLDNRSDIFSLGSLCYELVTSRRAFPGDNVFQVMEAIKTRKPVEPKKINPDIPSWLQNIIAKMMTKNPENRYPTAGKIIESIEFHQKNEDDKAPVNDTITSKFLKSMLLIDNPWS